MVQISCNSWQVAGSAPLFSDILRTNTGQRREQGLARKAGAGQFLLLILYEDKQSREITIPIIAARLDGISGRNSKGE